MAKKPKAVPAQKEEKGIDPRDLMISHLVSLSETIKKNDSHPVAVYAVVVMASGDIVFWDRESAGSSRVIAVGAMDFYKDQIIMKTKQEIAGSPSVA